MAIAPAGEVNQRRRDICFQRMENDQVSLLPLLFMSWQQPEYELFTALWATVASSNSSLMYYENWTVLQDTHSIQWMLLN